MLPKKQRLRRKEVALVIRKGTVQKTPLFFVRSFPLKETSIPPRFAVILPKHFYTSIVERNRLRRKAYAHIQNTQELFSPGHLYVCALRQNDITFPPALSQKKP